MTEEMLVEGDLSPENARRLIEQLRRERDCYRRLADLSTQSLVEADSDYRIIAANRAYAARFGLEPEDIVGRDIQDVVGPEPYKMVRAAIEKGESKRLEIQASYSGLGSRWVELEFRVLRDTTGRVIGINGAATDITDRKRGELQLRQANALLEGIIDAVEALIFVKDCDGKYLLVNRAFEQAFNKRREEMIGKTDADIVSPAQAQVYREHDERVLASGERLRFEETGPAMGELRSYVVSKFPLKNQHGEVEALCGLATDITDLKDLQNRLQETESELRFALAAGRMANWDWDLTTGVLQWSAFHFELLEYAPFSFEPRYAHWASRVHPEDMPRVEAVQQASLAQGADMDIEYRVLLPSGKVRWMTSRARVRMNSAGMPAHLTGVMFDITPAKELEQSLRESEARYREQAALLDLAHDAIIVRDMSGRIRYWNPAAGENYGWSTAEVMGRLSHDLLRTEFPEPLEKIAESLLRDGYWQGELIHHRRDRSELVADSRWALRRDADGQPVAVLEMNRDITRRKQTERALHEKQERLIAALDAAGAGTFRWNLRTNQLEWDDSLDGLFGLARGTTVRSLSAFIARVHPDDRPGVVDRCQRCASLGADFEMEFRVIWPDGSEHWIYDRGKTFFDSAGQPDYMTGACVDITERKLTEERLRALETRERIILEHLPVGVWFVDREGTIVYGNKVAQEIWGGARYVETEKYGEYKGSWHGTGEPIPAHEWAAARAFRERKPFLNQLIDITAFDGARKTMMNSAAPVLLPNGNFEGVVVFNLDVTEQARMQTALRRSHEELEARVAERTAKLRETIEALEAFSYSISHDMRSPLRSMQGFADALLREHGKGLPADAQDMLGRIQRAAHRLDLLILDVLSYGRIAKEQIDLVPVDLEALVRELLTNYPSFQPPQASVSIDSPLGRALGHPAFLSQIFSNLLSNAVKFVAPGTHPVIHLRSVPEGDDLRVWVEDNGIGIEPEHVARVFEMFGRIHPAKKYEGTGIGLTIVKKAVERMAGRIGFDSTPGKGSKFWFTLRRVK